MSDDDLDEAPICERCGGPRPEGPSICPACEDLERSHVRLLPPRGPPPREPPHGNTTR